MSSFWKWCIDTCNVMICCIKVRLFWRCVWFARIWHWTNYRDFTRPGTPKGSWGRDFILFQGDLGWWNIITIVFLSNVFLILTPTWGKSSSNLTIYSTVSNGLVKNHHHQLDTLSRYSQPRLLTRAAQKKSYCIQTIGNPKERIPTDPWNIPQALNYTCLWRKSFHILYFGVPGVCSSGLFQFS